MIHTLLRYSDTRKAMLDFIQETLSLNARRTRLQVGIAYNNANSSGNYWCCQSFLQVDRRKCSSDGFMLNLLYVMQQLCLRIKLNKVSGASHTVVARQSVTGIAHCITFTAPSGYLEHWLTPSLPSRWMLSTSTILTLGSPSNMRLGSAAPPKSSRKSRKNLVGHSIL